MNIKRLVTNIFIILIIGSFVLGNKNPVKNDFKKENPELKIRLDKLKWNLIEPRRVIYIDHNKNRNM